MKKLKILHCPTMVGGNPQGLARAERALGQDSRSLALTRTYFNYAADEVLFADPNFSLRNEGKRWRAIFRALTRYDVIHYNFGQSLAPACKLPAHGARWKVWLYNSFYGCLEFLDVALAARLGRVVAVTYQGSDARQDDVCRRAYPIHFAHETAPDPGGDALKRRRIARFDKYADLIYAVNPDLLNVLPPRAQFIPYACVDPRDWTPIPAAALPDIPHIVHAPSDRRIKGTRYILDACARLKEEGVPFRYTLIEGISNAEARAVYETADLLVDQLLAGYYGGLAVELMALGKPVICYMRAQDMRHLPAGMRESLPLIDATPDTIYDVLKEWLTVRKAELPARGLASRAYVEEWHDPQKIAARLIGDYRRVYEEKHA